MESRESFVFTSSAFSFGGRSCTKASFPHFPLSDFDGSLARKLRFHICDLLLFQLSALVLRSGFGAAISEAVVFGSSAFCKPVPADCTAAPRLLGAVAVRAYNTLFFFAAGHRNPYWSGCIKVAIVICQQISSILAIVIFLFKIPFKRLLAGR